MYNSYRIIGDTVNHTNPLLQRGGLGRAPPTVYDLPSNDFAFGIHSARAKFGVGQLTSEWLESKVTLPA